MDNIENLIKKLNSLDTEKVNPNSTDIDLKNEFEIVKLINDEDKKVASVVESNLELIAITARAYAETLSNNGRIYYIGAGTSGRLGVLDAAECPPTFGTDPSQIIGLISGGYETLILSQEGVEDNEQAAVSDLKTGGLSKHDMVIGIAASTRTPYTISGLKYANAVGCKTGFIICNKWDENNDRSFVDFLIELPVGPEVITGSTRMKSGTAQKMTLNMISTTAMVLLGKTYGNLMVDLKSTSEKLKARSRKILMELFEIEYKDADMLLLRADGSVKIAIVMKKFSCTKQKAEELLKQADNFISKIDKDAK
ncbi:MAG: N-acetylmuramic acid 6-phosphate etherase [Calditrichaeota bacterium]|nr:MAG: N-acetylmuramic acid 6-phosphate etherase [Calditrichota bacterium]